MKRKLLAFALLAVSSAANAGLSFNQLSTASRTEAFNVATLPFYAVGTSLGLGALENDEAGTITFTYLGQESGYNNKFYLTIGTTQMLTENPIGTQASALVNTTGAVSFKFEGNTGKFAINGGTWASGTSIGLIGTNMTVSSGLAAGNYQYVIGYNDSAGASTLGDWDDYVVGVNFTPAVPEPEIYAMMGLGLGLMGWASRRRKQQAA
jgi:hypothetical protein